MYIVLGATGNIGSELTKLLAQKEKKVIGITHNKDRIQQIEHLGARPAVVDVRDTEKLTQIFNKGQRLFLLNPPGDISKNASEQEFKTVDSIIKAIENSNLEKVVAESTYGAQVGNNIGDLGVLHHMEQSLARLRPATIIIRGAYYMSNWNMAIETAKTEGKIYSLFPPDFRIPMAAPVDIARLAARFLTNEVDTAGPHYVEGPQDYSPKDVSCAFAEALDTPVQTVEIKPDEWLDFLMKAGFSEESAESMVNMIRLTLKQDFEKPKSPIRGETSLQQYVDALIGLSK